MGGVALYVSAVIGPGILTLPAAAAQIAGPLSLVAVGALLLVSVPAAFAFVDIHRASVKRPPTASIGLQRYAALAFGDLAGRVVAAWFYLGVPIGVPALGLIGGSYVASAVGGGRVTTVVVAWLIVALAMVIVLARGGSSSALTLGLTVALVVLILGAALVSMPRWRPDHLGVLAPHGGLAIVPAALTVAWVLMGWEASTNFTSLLRDPHRLLPRVIAISLAVVVLLYAAVAVPELLVLGPFAGATNAPVAAMLRDALGTPATSWRPSSPWCSRSCRLSRTSRASASSAGRCCPRRRGGAPPAASGSRWPHQRRSRSPGWCSRRSSRSTRAGSCASVRARRSRSTCWRSPPGSCCSAQALGAGGSP